MFSNKSGSLNSYFTQSDLRSSYKYVALVSHSRHVIKISSDLSDTLIVSTDWLLTMKLCNENFHALYFEAGLQNWNDEKLESELYLRANDWVFIDGIDRTKYRGVSLGKLFVRDISYIYISYERLKQSLTNICSTYKPQQIFFYDFRSEVGLLDCQIKSELVSEICSIYGARFVDFSDCVDGNDDEFPQKQVYGSSKPPDVSFPMLRKVFDLFWELLSALLTTRNHTRKKIAVMTGGHLAQILSLEIPNKEIIPIYFSSVLKKSPIVLAKTILRGGYLSSSLTNTESKVNFSIIENIRKIYNDYWNRTECSKLDKFVRRFIATNIFESSRIKFYCSQIDSTKTFLDKHKPYRILLDSVLSPNSRIPMELSKQMGIKVDYIWHGFIQQIILFDALGGDSRSEVLVDRIYTWGSYNERWLENVEWKGEFIRVGNPITQKYITDSKLI